ncbi:MAG: hypothetical protein IJS66_04430, partial [Bacteroidales bacterium]|nr:hypothetical protein [Bacteroidales bacterium]
MAKGDFLIGFLGKCAEAGMGFFDAARLFRARNLIKQAVDWNEDELGPMPGYWNSIGEGAQQAMLERKRLMRDHDRIAYPGSPKKREAVTDFDAKVKRLAGTSASGSPEYGQAMNEAAETFKNNPDIQQMAKLRTQLYDQTEHIRNKTYTTPGMQAEDRKDPGRGRFLNEGGVEYSDPYSRRLMGYTVRNEEGKPVLANKDTPGAKPYYSPGRTVRNTRAGARNDLAVA